jgi:hypothetical protein
VQSFAAAPRWILRQSLPLANRARGQARLCGAAQGGGGNAAVVVWQPTAAVGENRATIEGQFTVAPAAITTQRGLG